jgi:hypothetical protein
MTRITQGLDNINPNLASDDDFEMHVREPNPNDIELEADYRQYYAEQRAKCYHHAVSFDVDGGRCHVFECDGEGYFIYEYPSSNGVEWVVCEAMPDAPAYSVPGSPSTSWGAHGARVALSYYFASV